MAVCPFAKHLLIPPGSNDPRITPRVAILHVDAGDNPSLHTYFRDRSGGIESHFHVRKDGVVEQYRDTDFEADANDKANAFAVSIETQGRGEGEWTAAQVASIQRLLKWLHQVHGIPLRKCPTWDGSGVGYHIQFGAPGAWTPVAKSCRGPDRIRQFESVIVPWMKEQSVSYTRGPNIDGALRSLRKARRAAKGKARRRFLTGVIRQLRQLPRWPKRR